MADNNNGKTWYSVLAVEECKIEYMVQAEDAEQAEDLVMHGHGTYIGTDEVREREIDCVSEDPDYVPDDPPALHQTADNEYNDYIMDDSANAVWIKVGDHAVYIHKPGGQLAVEICDGIEPDVVYGMTTITI